MAVMAHVTPDGPGRPWGRGREEGQWPGGGNN
jgi:hypothetical protein